MINKIKLREAVEETKIGIKLGKMGMNLLSQTGKENRKIAQNALQILVDTANSVLNDELVKAKPSMSQKELIKIILKVAMAHHDDISKQDEDNACEAADTILAGISKKQEVSFDKEKTAILNELVNGTGKKQEVDIEIICEKVHKTYCKYHLEHKGEEYWTKGDYSKLTEEGKEYDRRIVRAVLEALGTGKK